MFGLFKKKVPQWASFMDQAQYAAFMEALETFLKSSGAPDYKIDEGQLLFYGDGLFGLEQAGLLNLAQVCAQQRPREYPAVVAAHFESLKKSAEFFKNFDQELQDFEKIKDYLAVRVHGRDYVDQARETSVLMDIAEDLYAQLVFDLPDAVRSVHPDEAAGWNRSEGELFELGRANIRQNYPPEQQWYEHENSGFWLVGADHYFSPNIIWDMESHADLLGPQGALIGLPNRQAALICPIESRDLLSVIGVMIAAVNSMYAAGPGPITSHLFWYKNGQFTRLPYVLNDGQTELRPPEAFIEMIKVLPPGSQAEH